MTHLEKLNARITFRKDNSENNSGDRANSEAATVIQARDTEGCGIGAWTYSREAKGIKSTGPVAKLDM